MTFGSTRSRPQAKIPREPLTRRHTLLGLAAALLLAGLPACAHDTGHADRPVVISIVDRGTGQILPVHRKDGRDYVAGMPAARYGIRLSNRSAGRVLVVLSVDGVNVISGQTAASSQTGYVLDPWRTYEITGWRKSDTEIAAFEFAALADSYAARTGRPGNVGVIGAAVFLERPAPLAALPPPAASRQADSTGAAAGRLEGSGDDGRAARDATNEATGTTAKAAAPQAAAAPAVRSDEAAAARETLASRRAETTERLGTAHGRREWSVSTRTDFERMSPSPQAMLEIFYDSVPNLVTAGVIPRPPVQARAFPGDDGRGFVPDPPRR